MNGKRRIHGDKWNARRHARQEKPQSQKIYLLLEKVRKDNNIEKQKKKTIVMSSFLLNPRPILHGSVFDDHIFIFGKCSYLALKKF